MNLYRVRFYKKEDSEFKNENTQHIISAHNYEDAESHAKKWVEEGIGGVFNCVNAVGADEILLERQKYKTILFELGEKLKHSDISDNLKKELQDTFDLLEYW